MGIETTTIRNEKEVGDRNMLQRVLLQKMIEQKLLEKNDMTKLKEVFAKVSDIIDSDEERYASVVLAFKSGDYEFASDMIIEIISDR